MRKARLGAGKRGLKARQGAGKRGLEPESETWTVRKGAGKQGLESEEGCRKARFGVCLSTPLLVSCIFTLRQSVRFSRYLLVEITQAHFPPTQDSLKRVRKQKTRGDFHYALSAKASIILFHERKQTTFPQIFCRNQKRYKLPLSKYTPSSRKTVMFGITSVTNHTILELYCIKSFFLKKRKKVHKASA